MMRYLSSFERVLVAHKMKNLDPYSQVTRRGKWKWESNTVEGGQV
jgi:hypothetical protein